MSDRTAHERAQLAALRDACAQLAGEPAPDMAELERLSGQAHVLTQSADAEVAAEAQQLELHMLSQVLMARAALLRRLAHDLQRLALLLPPERPEEN